MSGLNGAGFLRPVQLLKSTNHGLQVNEEAVALLSKITQPVVVVSIAGKYRTGKSYILNLLSDLPQGYGFELGNTVESFTKGIWVYALPHPNMANTTLVLLDTEGTNDVKKGNATYDSTLLVLTILLSSTFVFNITGRMEDELIRQLGLISILVKCMKPLEAETNLLQSFLLYVANVKDFFLKSLWSRSKYESIEIDNEFFPQLVVLIRDFYLTLSLNGRVLTADEYFNDHCLQIKDASLPNSSEYNRPRELIRKYFPRRHCYTLPLPVADGELLDQLETLPEDQLDPDFFKRSKEFVRALLKISKPKIISENSIINGPILVTLLRNYLKALKLGTVPTIESVLEKRAREEREFLTELITSYKTKLRSLDLPIPTESITEIHKKTSNELLDEFKRRTIFAEKKGEMKEKFKAAVNAIYRTILRENEDVWKQKEISRCKKCLKEHSLTMTRNLQDNTYLTVCGYKKFFKDLDNVIKDYNKDTRLTENPYHYEVLSNFLDERYYDGRRILKLDKRMRILELKNQPTKKYYFHMFLLTVAILIFLYFYCLSSIYRTLVFLLVLHFILIPWRFKLYLVTLSLYYNIFLRHKLYRRCYKLKRL